MVHILTSKQSQYTFMKSIQIAVNNIFVMVPMYKEKSVTR